ncbi:hypothetical protein J6590_049801 [Homalodisca vitripennis]|nr:hypothetical protein J6590_049801 [Homalodisca vitripennis]
MSIQSSQETGLRRSRHIRHSEHPKHLRDVRELLRCRFSTMRGKAYEAQSDHPLSGLLRHARHNLTSEPPSGLLRHQKSLIVAISSILIVWLRKLLRRRFNTTQAV